MAIIPLSQNEQDPPFRVVLIHAPDPLYSSTQTYGAQFVPLWAYTLPAYFPKDKKYKIDIYDNRFDKVENIPKANLYIYSGINQDCEIVNKICKYLRDLAPSSSHIIGGPICVSFDLAGSLDKLNEFDSICIGDGEVLIEQVLNACFVGHKLPKIFRAKERFKLIDAKVIDYSLVQESLKKYKYYGAVVEVSRGCPFLCEFCDIRTLPDNNRTHIKSPDVIVAELDFFVKMGINQILIACDNFIGDIKAAEELLDAILAWEDKTGYQPGLYTWLTINLYKLPHILEKMRRCGFDLLFIGVESFNANALMETAKVQNNTVGLVEPILTIQSYGFIVGAGLIFGFDSDSVDTFDETLNGLRDAALLSGDPSLLVALPGTPLYRRMKLSGRLREIGFGLGGFKYQTNIKYLIPANEIISGYQYFVNEFIKGDYQLDRLKRFFELLNQGNFIPLKSGGGFGSISSYFKVLIADKKAATQMAIRLTRFALKPVLMWYAFRGLLLVYKNRNIPGAFGYFQFWFFAWTNTLLKYSNLSAKDFDIESVGPDFDIRNILPESYRSSANEPIPKAKINAQLRSTEEQLKRIISIKLIDA